MAAENDRPGTRAWSESATRLADEQELAGFTSTVSALPGEHVGLFVQSTLGSWTATAYRIGWYRGLGGRQIWQSNAQPGLRQPAEVIRAGGEVFAPWKQNLTVDTTGWPEGSYLIMLRASGKWKAIPLTLRSRSTAGKVVLVQATSTYAAYNTWGGYSLYKAPEGAELPRANRVSFHRPYDSNGASRYLLYEVAVDQRAERLGIPLAWTTSYDLEQPDALHAATGVVSLGHDEYWSPAMRQTVTAARDAGTNLAFLGANAVYWRIRFEGDGQTVVTYKGSGDPVRNAVETTNLWRAAPHADPENSLVGMLYECYPSQGPFVVGRGDFFLFAETGLHTGSQIEGLNGTETDRAYPGGGTPTSLEVVAHSPSTCGSTKRTYTDMTYYTTPSGSGVFATGTMRWTLAVRGPVAKLGIADDAVGFARTVTDNLLRAMAAGPMGDAHPSRPNLAQIRPAASTSTGTGGQIGAR
ncbi:MAG: N,N-dimethylformamidase beta subunit family domain-containing protein [Nostocoides sp.]